MTTASIPLSITPPQGSIMDMTSEAAAGGIKAPSVAVHTARGEGSLSLRAAADEVRHWRRKSQKESGRETQRESRNETRREQQPGSAASASALRDASREPIAEFAGVPTSADAAPPSAEPSGAESTVSEPEANPPPI